MRKGGSCYMRISMIKIKNMFGIREIMLNGKSVEAKGTNGAGKSAILDSIKYALSNKSDRDIIIRKGEDEAEVIIETNTGISINRKVRKGKVDYASVKNNGKVVTAPESFLREIFTELQLDPISFVLADKKEQNRIILDLIDYGWDINTIRGWFGEIVPEINYEQNILQVLNDIQAEKGYYFRKRQDINRDEKNHRHFISEIVKDIPKGYKADKWKKYNLGTKYKELETIRYENNQIDKAKTAVENRNNKARKFQADKEISISAIEKEIDFRGNEIKDEINELKSKMKELEIEKKGLEEKKVDKVAVIESEYKTNVAEFEAECKEYEAIADKSTKDTSKLEKELETAEEMKAIIREYDRMIELQSKQKELIEASKDLTDKIELARNLPAEILKECSIPIKGLTIVDGEPYINDLSISNLSDGEKLKLAFEVVTAKQNNLEIVLLDRIECLSDKNRKDLYKQAKKNGIQIIACRTTNDDELKIIEL